MQPAISTTPEDLMRGAALILEEAPAGALPPKHAAALRAPTNLAIREATGALVASNCEDLARKVYAIFWERSDLGPWTRVNMAKLLEQRGRFDESADILRVAIERFPQRAAPHWWVALSRCERAMGLVAQAEATARDGVARFPASSPMLAFLADFLDKAERSEESATVWRRVIDVFPSERQVHWFTSLATALRSTGRGEQAYEALEEMGRALPDDPQTLPLLAQAAGERHKWGRALDVWTLCGEKHAATLALEAASGRARALFRLWRIDEAMEIWRDLMTRQPHFGPAFREMGAAALELGDFAQAESCLRTLVDRFPELAKAERYAQLAHSLNDQRKYAEADCVLAELSRLFPESPLAFAERIRLAGELERGQDETSALVEAAMRGFPGDRGFQAGWVLVLLGFGKLDEAKALVNSLEAGGSDAHALVSRLRWEADATGDQHLERIATDLTAGRSWTLNDVVPVVDFLHRIWSYWSNRLINSMLAELAPKFPNQIGILRARARALIALRDDEGALAVIDEIPPKYRRTGILELKAWAAARRGQDEDAKHLWRLNIASTYFAALHRQIDVLERLSPPGQAPPTAGVTAYIVFRNETPQIPAFLDHHRKLGVRRFVFIDHESTDESRALLLAQPDVALYRSPDSFRHSWAGRRWVNELIEREGGAGWRLIVDADEWFVYPGWETVPLDRFTEYLDEIGAEGVRGYMLDVFPRRLLDENGEPTAQKDYRYYDADYGWLGLERPPYLKPIGGARARLFEASEFLHKVPLWRADRGVIIDAHETTHLRFADVTGALLHFKLLNIALRSRRARREDAGAAYLDADANVEVMRRHSRYAARLAKVRRSDLFQPGVSAELSDSLTLAQRGLIEAPPAYLDWLRREARP